jgi:hypothetical protein
MCVDFYHFITCFVFSLFFVFCAAASRKVNQHIRKPTQDQVTNCIPRGHDSLDLDSINLRSSSSRSAKTMLSLCTTVAIIAGTIPNREGYTANRVDLPVSETEQ